MSSHSVITRRRSRFHHPDSFTLIELLVVMAIIAILAGLTLAAASGVMKTAGRNRAKGEIQAMSTALESYKTDNGIYPSVSTFASTNGYTADPSTTDGPYQIAAQDLYQALSGKEHYSDTTFTTNTFAVGKTYMSFKTSQLGNYKNGVADYTYVQDPFGYAYGYYTGTAATAATQTTTATSAQYPNNGDGFFDLWSTAGVPIATTRVPVPSVQWITNWGS